MSTPVLACPGACTLKPSAFPTLPIRNVAPAVRPQPRLGFEIEPSWNRSSPQRWRGGRRTDACSSLDACSRAIRWASSPVAPEALERIVRYRQTRGYRVTLGAHIRAALGYRAGSADQRIEDLMAMFLDPRVRAILPANGGRGASHLLPLLDYRVIQASSGSRIPPFRARRRDVYVGGCRGDRVGHRRVLGNSRIPLLCLIGPAPGWWGRRALLDVVLPQGRGGPSGRSAPWMSVRNAGAWSPARVFRSMSRPRACRPACPGEGWGARAIAHHANRSLHCARTD